MKLSKLLICVIAMTIPVASTTAAPLFTDNFDSGASAQWGNEIGSWTVTGGQYHATAPSNAPPTVSSLPLALTDFIFDVDITDIQDGGVWLRAELHPTTKQVYNGVLLVTGGYHGSYSGFYWHTVTNGSYSVALAKVNGLFTPGVSDVHIQLVVEDDTYQVFLNGSTTAATTLTTSAYSSGRVGLYDYSNQKFDNVVLNIPEPATMILTAAGLPFLLKRKRKS